MRIECTHKIVSHEPLQSNAIVVRYEKKNTEAYFEHLNMVILKW